MYDVTVRGVPTHAYFTIFRSYSTSGCSALLLRPLGGDAANTGQLAVLNLTAIQLSAGCLPAEISNILRSEPLVIIVRGAAASRAFPSTELLRRAVSRGAALEGGVTEEKPYRLPT